MVSAESGVTITVRVTQKGMKSLSKLAMEKDMWRSKMFRRRIVTILLLLVHLLVFMRRALSDSIVSFHINHPERV